MGIPGLTKFLTEEYSWKPVDFKEWDHVVIDGNNVFNMLYKQHVSWALGGEYDKFGAKIREFFCDYPFKHPIVVFDGPHYNLTKMATMKKRRKATLKQLEKMQRRSNWETDRTQGSVSPLLLFSTVIETLRDMKVEFYIADEEADKEIAALANHHKCPVVGSDSDFFIFNLTHGFIHYERLSDKLDSLYCSQDLLKVSELCLLLPAFFGNDFFKGETSHHSIDDYSLFIDTVKKYENCEEYLSSSENTVRREKFNEMQKFYWELPLPSFYTSPPEAKLESRAGLPEWVYRSFKEGKFSKQLLNVYIFRESLAPPVVEAIEFESAWMISRYIRERLYHIMGIGREAEVKEIIRPPGKVELVENLVPAVNLSKQPITIEQQHFTANKVEMMSDLVLTLLKCHKISQEDIESKFNTLDDKWKLPIAATFYWYYSLGKMEPPPVDAETMKKLAMSLLLTFLMTSGTLTKPPGFSFERVTYETKSDHLKALHAYAQWQCVYLDAMALNFLAREPFHTTNPACLYSGSTAMYLALVASWRESMVDDAFKGKASERLLFNRFLFLVTGEGKAKEQQWKTVAKR